METITLNRATWVQGLPVAKGELKTTPEIAAELRLLGYVEGDKGFTFARKSDPGFTGKFERVPQK